MISFLTQLFAGLAARQARKRVIRDVWSIGYRPTPRDGTLVPSVPAHGSQPFHRTPCPARPLLRRPIHRPKRRASLSYFSRTIDGNQPRRDLRFAARWRRSRDIVVALQRPYHLSYPCVFRSGGEWYMTPETRARRRVELFKAEQFPDRWLFVRALVEDVDAVDPTVFEHAWPLLAVCQPRGRRSLSHGRAVLVLRGLLARRVEASSYEPSRFRCPPGAFCGSRDGPRTTVAPSEPGLLRFATVERSCSTASAA